MTITVKFNQLVNSVKAMKELGSLRLKGKAGYDAAKLVKLADVEMAIFNEHQNKLGDQYGVKSEDGTTYKFPDPVKLKKFVEEMNELALVEVKLEATKLKVDDLVNASFTDEEGKYHSDGASTALYVALDWAIEG